VEGIEGLQRNRRHKATAGVTELNSNSSSVEFGHGGEAETT
jgi:hypothetical protein